MPPKPRFKREEIVAAAMEIVSLKGIEALTAQELRDALECSASPIFTVFNTMKEIQDEVRIFAMQKFEKFVATDLTASSDMPIFKQVGMKMILFSVQEPKLYQLLFMQENRSAVTFDDVFSGLGDTAILCINAIKKDYGLTEEQAERLFRNVWIYTFGIGALCATRVCHFTEAELAQMLTTEFQAMWMFLSGEHS